MQSYSIIITQLLTHINNNDPEAVVNTIKNYLEPNAQRAQLKTAFIFFRTDKNGIDTILNYAIKMHSMELIELLTQKDLIPKSFYTNRNYGLSLFEFAVQYGYCDYVEKFLINKENPEDPNKMVEYGYQHKTNLMGLAIRNLEVKMVELLLNYNAKIVDSLQPIYDALTGDVTTETKRINQIKIIKLLIDKGANVLMKTPKGNSLLEFAETSILVNEDVTSLLREEVKKRTLLNKTIPLLFWASKNDPNSSVYGAPQEIVQQISNITRNQQI